MLCSIRRTQDLGTTTCRCLVSLFSDSLTPYRVSWLMHSECHWAHRIFTSLYWSEISSHLDRESCSLAHRIGPISPSSNRYCLHFFASVNLSFLVCTSFFFSWCWWVHFCLAYVVKRALKLAWLVFCYQFSSYLLQLFQLGARLYLHVVLSIVYSAGWQSDCTFLSS